MRARPKAGDVSRQLAAAQARITELEAVATEARRQERIQAALYRIAEAASDAKDMQAFYRGIHSIVAELVYAENCYIALYDEVRRLINWPFAVDSVDLDWPDASVWEPMGTGTARGLTAYVLRTGAPLHASKDVERDLIARGEVERIGAEGADWLGVPLNSEGRTIGVLVVQSYREDIVYNEEDERLLTFVAQHIGAALTRVRAIEETRQRTAELAVVNDVGRALAAQLEFNAIIDLVGERIRESFAAPYMYIALYDETAGVITFPYDIAAGKPAASSEPIPFGEGLTSILIRTRQPLLLHTWAEQDALGAIDAGEPDESYLGVPIIVGERVLGAIGIANERPHAFGDADVRLMTTLASSLGVALENAKLFHHTHRRAAELAIVNRVGQAVSAQLDLDALIGRSATRWGRPFAADVVYVALHDTRPTSSSSRTTARGTRHPRRQCSSARA